MYVWSVGAKMWAQGIIFFFSLWGTQCQLGDHPDLFTLALFGYCSVTVWYQTNAPGFSCPAESQTCHEQG